jgi:MSHA biogenesis protein MshK
MAETLTLPRLLLCALALCLAQAGAHAQSMQDPTRPAETAVAGEGEAADAGPQLQSVLIARQPGGRHVAVIDGETVRLGEMFRGARVARITPLQVELVRGKDRQVLRLVSIEEPSPAVKPAARLK